MKVLIHDMLRSPVTWGLILLPIASMMVIVALGFYFSRTDTQSRIDKSTAMAIDKIRAEILALHEADARSRADREKMHRTVDQLKGLGKAVESIKEAIKAEGREP